MVGVAQLVERRIVIPVVEGSIPFVHPIKTLTYQPLSTSLSSYTFLKIATVTIKPFCSIYVQLFQ